MKALFTRVFVASFILAFMFQVLVPVTAAYTLSTQSVDVSQWDSQAGDFLVVDVSENMGYLLREDMTLGTSFPVATGQLKTLHYIGMKYYGATPTKEWHVKSLDYQTPGPIFGPHGKFLRLYDEYGRTHYGIHTVGNEKEIFSLTDRYKSWGCVLVRDSILSTIQDVYTLSGDAGMRVITLDSLESFPIDLARLKASGMSS